MHTNTRHSHDGPLSDGERSWLDAGAARIRGRSSGLSGVIRCWLFAVVPLAGLGCGDKDAGAPSDTGTSDPAGCDELTWFWDADGDGFGDDDIFQVDCDASSGWVTSGGDCDDDDPAVHPAATEDCTDPRDLDCDGDSTWADVDGDGSPACMDCDDEDDGRAPERTEVCDGVDNDCDGLLDDEDEGLDLDTAETWWRDADADGFGDPGLALQACQQPDGYTDNDADCADDDPAVSPAARERCDEADVDEDCDGLADDEDPDVLGDDLRRFLPDVDGDGFGDADSEGRLACDDPSSDGESWTEDGSDCDDGDATVNPDASEVCDEADVDEDCNGLADDADPGVSPSSLTAWNPDDDGDGFGASDGPTTETCEDPSTSARTWVADASDCDDEDDAIHPDAAELCDGIDNDCDTSTTEAGTVTFGDGEGVLTDVSSAWAAGTSTSAAAWTTPSDGTLSICEGTWHVNLSVEHDVVIAGRESADLSVLDGAGSGPVLDVDAGVALTLRDLTVTGGSHDEGGGISLGDGASLRAEDVRLIDNSGSDAAALYGSDAAVELVAVEVAGNTGPALFLDDGSFVGQDLEVTDNTAGTALKMWYGDVVIESSSFTDNDSDEYYGGAVLISEASLEIDGTEFSRNGSDDGASGVVVVYGAATITDTTFVDGSGSGLLLVYSDVVMTDVEFSGNHSKDHGGALKSINSTCDLDGLDVRDNTADDRGGGVWLYGTHGAIANSTITGNSSDGWGGGLVLDSVFFELEEVTLEGNAGEGLGGGILLDLGGLATVDGTGVTSIDNDPDDLYHLGTWTTYSPGASASFSCDESGCE